MNIVAAVAQLNQRLPLQARQQQLDTPCRAAHRAILRGFIQYGRALTSAELQGLFATEPALQSCLQRLEQDDLVVMDAQQQVVGAYPLTMARTPHAISVNDHHLYAMCALDALAIAPLFGVQVRIDSRCHVQQTPVSILMHDQRILLAEPSDAIHVGVHWQQPCGHAATSLCMEMVFLTDRETALRWQGGDTQNYAIFTLPEAVAFGAAYFQPLLAERD